APSYPSWFCADGRHQGGRGPCTRLQDGSCGYVHLVCPEDRTPVGARGACTAAECGSPPAFTTWSCPGGNGTGAFATCKRDREGRCGWIPRPGRAEAQQVVRSRPAPPPPPPRATEPRSKPRPKPAAGPPVTRSCAHLPGTDEVRTWPVVAVCA